MNTQVVRYGFPGAPIIDPVQCEHGLTVSVIYKNEFGEGFIQRGQETPKQENCMLNR